MGTNDNESKPNIVYLQLFAVTFFMPRIKNSVVNTSLSTSNELDPSVNPSVPVNRLGCRWLAQAMKLGDLISGTWNWQSVVLAETDRLGNTFNCESH